MDKNIKRNQIPVDDADPIDVPNLNEQDDPGSEDAELLFEEPFQKERIGWSTSTVLIVLAVVALVLIGIGVMIFLLPDSDGHVVINEAMSSNDTAFIHPVYGSVDWVEIYNPTEREIDLSGFGFTNEIKKQYKYVFPEGTVIEAKGYLLLYCTGGTNETDRDPFCTGFSLSQEGETLYLIDRGYLELDELQIPMLETDSAYARDKEGVFQITRSATPGTENRIP